MPHTHQMLQLAVNTLQSWGGNVRKAPETVQAHEELKASIKAHGLLENLIVIETDAGRHLVISGCRRLKALQALIEEGRLAPDTKVHCQLSKTSDATDISLTENVVRIAMHPLDELEAFAKLSSDGMTVDQIATRYGKSPRMVQQRLKLGQVHEEVRAAYGRDEITLECLMAFTLTADPSEQFRLFSDLGGAPHAWKVRQVLTEGAVPSAHRLASFVGLEAYQEAGGRVKQDLFSDNGSCLLEDRALLEKLAADKLTEAAAALHARMPWKWVTPMLEMDYSFLSSCQRLTAATFEASDEVQTRLDAIEDRLEALSDLDNPETELDAEYRQLLDERDALRMSLKDWSHEDYSRGGVLVVVDQDGRIATYDGLIRPEDQVRGGPVLTDGPKEYSTALLNDLRFERLAITQAHLVESFECALDVLLLSMARAVTAHPNSQDLLGVRCNLPLSTQCLDEMCVTTPKLPDELTEASGWPSGSLTDEYRTVCSWDQATKRRVFAYCVARTLLAEGAETLLSLESRLGVDMNAHWRPTAERFWKRIPKSKALEIAGDILGHEWVKLHRDQKKAALGGVLEDIFAGNRRPGVSTEQAAAAADWLPDIMACEPDQLSEADDRPIHDFEESEGAQPSIVAGAEDIEAPSFEPSDSETSDIEISDFGDNSPDLPDAFQMDASHLNGSCTM